MQVQVEVKVQSTEQNKYFKAINSLRKIKVRGLNILMIVKTASLKACKLFSVTTSSDSMSLTKLLILRGKNKENVLGMRKIWRTAAR